MVIYCPVYIRSPISTHQCLVDFTVESRLVQQVPLQMCLESLVYFILQGMVVVSLSGCTKIYNPRIGG